MKKIELVVCILVVAFSFEAQQVSARRVLEIGMPVCQSAKDSPDFVHDMSVFDICYPVFRQLYDRFANYEARFDSRFDSHLFPDFPSRGNYETMLRPEREVCLRYAKQLAAVRDSLYAEPGFGLDKEREMLEREILTFGDTATALPTVYVLIATKYGGDVRAYVDDLFDGSVMTNAKRMKRFVRHPTKKRMREDMGFQFVVSKLMYHLWEAQGRPAQPAADGTRLVVLRSELEKR